MKQILALLPWCSGPRGSQSLSLNWLWHSLKTVLPYSLSHEIVTCASVRHTLSYLAIADFFVGTVSGPIHIYHTMTFEPGSGFGWGKFIVMFFEGVFFACSLLHLTLLSLERHHATLFPFRHCLILNWVYFKAVVCICFLAVILISTSATFFLISRRDSKYIWASLIVAALFTVIVSYVIIALNVKRRVPPYSSYAGSSEKKLTVTLFVVIVLSTLTILSSFCDVVLEVSTRLRGSSAEAR